MMLPSSDFQKVREILTEAIAVVCKNGLQFNSQFSVEGLLGITVDNSDIFLVNINQKIRSDTVRCESDTNGQETVHVETVISDGSSTEDSPQRKSGASRRAFRKKRHHSSTSETASKRASLPRSETPPIDSDVIVKEELVDDNMTDIVIVKEENDMDDRVTFAGSTPWRIVPADMESYSRRDHPASSNPTTQNHSQMPQNLHHSFYPCQDNMTMYSGAAPEYPYRCPYEMCRFGTDRKWNLKRHLRKHETNQKYQCQLCSSKYVDTYLLRAHMIQRHTDKQCTSCWSFVCDDKHKCRVSADAANSSSQKDSGNIVCVVPVDYQHATITPADEQVKE